MWGFEINDVVNSVLIKTTNLFCLTLYEYSDKLEIHFVSITFVSSYIRRTLSKISYSICVLKISLKEVSILESGRILFSAFNSYDTSMILSGYFLHWFEGGKAVLRIYLIITIIISPLRMSVSWPYFLFIITGWLSISINLKLGLSVHFVMILY